MESMKHSYSICFGGISTIKQEKEMTIVEVENKYNRLYIYLIMTLENFKEYIKMH